MYCPQCGLERISVDTSFCSRCGYLLTGTADLLLTGGLIPQQTKPSIFQNQSPRSRGIKQGAFIFLLSILVVPLLMVFSIVFQLRSPALVIAAMILLVAGGLLRIAYAWMFESPVPNTRPFDSGAFPVVENFDRPAAAQLPPQQSVPVAAYAAPATGNWRETNDLEPRSVTENTTRLLENEELPQ